MKTRPQASYAPQNGPPRLRPLSIVLWTAWFGTISGTGELVVFLGKCHYFDPRNYNLSHHFPWMYPVAGILVLAGPGLLLALGAHLWPQRITSSAVLFVLSFVTFLGLLCRCPIYSAVCLFLAAGLAFRTAQLLAVRAESVDRLVRRSLVVLVVLVAATACASYGRQTWTEHRAVGRLHQGRGQSGARNVILIVLDTVRGAKPLRALWLPPRYYPKPDAAGGAWRAVRPRLRDGPLDCPLAREHVHWTMESRALSGLEPAARRAERDPR